LLEDQNPVGPPTGHGKAGPGTRIPIGDGLQAGEEFAASELWARYFERLVRLVRKKLWRASQRMADAEDVALSALWSFCRCAREGKFPHLQGSEELWRLLVVIASRKASDLRQRQRRKRRGGGRVRGESVFTAGPLTGWDDIAGREPSPEVVALVAEEETAFLDSLDDPTLRRIASYKLEGRTNEEVSQALSCSLRTVARKMVLIRRALEARLH